MFLTAICHKGGKSLEIRGFFSTFLAGINFRGFNKIEYFAGTHFCDFKISTTKVYRQKKLFESLKVLGMVKVALVLIKINKLNIRRSFDSNKEIMQHYDSAQRSQADGPSL